MPDQQPYTGPTKVVIAFDVGTINSAVSYCILEQGQIPQIHCVNRFHGQEYGDSDARVPSILYYDTTGDVQAIGSAALADKSLIERAEAEGWMVVECWKLHQPPKHLAYTHIKADDIPPLPPGKSVEDVLTDFIRHLSQCTHTYIEENHPGSKLHWPLSIENALEFVFTHPNGWDDAQQQKYRRAAEHAGLVPATPAGRSRVHLIPEGEASLHYCLSSLPEQPGKTDPQGTVIIDAGGGIINLSMYSITYNPVSCEEIAPAECRLQGSVLVTRRAVAFLQEWLQGSPHSSLEDIAELAREFDEKTKLSISSRDKVARIKINEIRYNNPEFNIKRGFLELSGNDATALFEDSVQAIICAFENQLRFTTTKITMAFLVGGFASNRWLWTRLRSYFKTKGIEFSRPDDDVNKAAAHGAVLSQIDRDHPLVWSRFSHETYAAKCATLENQKRANGTQQDAIANILELTGLAEAKQQVLRIKGIIDMMNRQRIPIDKERLNLVLLGNPGTGKTTVARLYAQFLRSIKALPGNAFLETTGSKLAFEGMQGAQKLIDDALKAGGGAIFIDEAYQLTSEFNVSGKQVLDFLLAEMENRVGKLVFILAGHNKQMEKFFEHNPGLPSRVPYQLRFADYADQELMSMLEDLIYKGYKGRMKVEDTINGLYVRIAIKRLGRGRGTPGFGNARALQNMFTKIRQRQLERLDREQNSGSPVDELFLAKEDLIGPDPSKVLSCSAPWAKLQKMIGLESVKNSVHNLFSLLETNYQRELAEKEPLQISLNRLLLGSSGTGKTTVAKLYGQILAEIGMLSNGEVVVKNPTDFIGSHLGESERNTKAILDNTRGKVLVIDEAYMLYNKGSPDSYKTAVIDTIVAEIQSVPGEDRCVLLLGYKEQMEEMFQNANPGLARRFAVEDAFVFEDFTEPELLQILEYKLKAQDLSATDDAKKVALELLSRMKNRPNFGNAGEVENLLGQAKARYQRRVASVPVSRRIEVVFEPQDFDPNFDRSQKASENFAKIFADFVGCDEVIKKLEGYQKIARVMKEMGRDMRTLIPSNFVFKGPPGTGKTSIAKKLGQVYYDMGFLASPEVFECSATDLVGQFVGHTGPKTKGLCEKALGKVLFIDEAYRLSEGQFAKEAMDEIVGLMTQERFMNKLVIVLAGYENEMNGLLATNPGLSSRFSEEIIFHNMTADQCLDLLDKELRKQDIVIPELTDKTSLPYVEMQGIIIRMSSLPSWGNGRDIKTLGKRMTQKAFANAANHGSLSLSEEEALSVMKIVLHERLARQEVVRTAPSWRASPMSMMNGFAPPPPSMFTSTSEASKRAPPPPESLTSLEEPQAPQRDFPPPNSLRDVGVSDTIWNQLQADIKSQEEARRAAEEERHIAQELKEAEERRQAEIARAAAELERAREIEKANLAKKREIERQLEVIRRHATEQKAAAEKAAAALKQKRAEDAERMRKEGEIHRKLQFLGLCPMGYQWVRQGDGYRCTGGSHFIPHSQLAKYF